MILTGQAQHYEDGDTLEIHGTRIQQYSTLSSALRSTSGCVLLDARSVNFKRLAI